MYKAEQEREIRLIHVVPQRKDKWIRYLALSYLYRPLQSEDYDAIDESLCRFEEKKNSGSLELKFCHPRYEEILQRKYVQCRDKIRTYRVTCSSEMTSFSVLGRCFLYCRLLISSCFVSLEIKNVSK